MSDESTEDEKEWAVWQKASALASRAAKLDFDLGGDPPYVTYASFLDDMLNPQKRAVTAARYQAMTKEDVPSWIGDASGKLAEITRLARDIEEYNMLSTLKGEGVHAISPETTGLLEEIDCSDVNATFENIAEEARDIIEEHGGVMRDRGNENYETIPFSSSAISELEDERHAAAIEGINRQDAVFGHGDGQQPGHGIDYSASRSAEEVRHSKASEGFNLDAALDKAENTAKSEQVNLRDDANLQTSKQEKPSTKNVATER